MQKKQSLIPNRRNFSQNTTQNTVLFGKRFGTKGSRVVPRLDGGRGKKQAWWPHVRT